MLVEKPLKIVEKLWGRELWYHNDSDYCMKILILKSGFQSSLHFHKIKRETFIVVDGAVELLYDGEIFVLTKTNKFAFDIEPGVTHQFRALETKSPLFDEREAATIIEVSTYHDDTDVYRIEESRKL